MHFYSFMVLLGIHTLYHAIHSVLLLSSSFTSAGQLFQPHRRTSGGFRVGGGVHDSYTFQCGLVGYFSSPGIGLYRENAIAIQNEFGDSIGGNV